MDANKNTDLEQLNLFDGFVFDEDQADPKDKSDTHANISCECGCLKLGYLDPQFHSTWCPYYKLK